MSGAGESVLAPVGFVLEEIAYSYHDDVPGSNSRAWEPGTPELRYAPDQRPQGVRREMLERIGHGAQVLDVGCWSGATAAFLGLERDAAVDGVEPEAEMAELAAASCRVVYRSTIEDALEQLLAERQGSYDAVLFLDVLEHLVDPLAVLAEARGLLRPGGRGFVSIPNVAHWSLRYELLRGRWRYRDNGLLDRTHLRFFTRASTLELAREAGWELTWEGAAIGRPPLIDLPESGLRALERWRALFAVQFLLELRPA
jgi:2-polyprenyl-3-methyl-5-hydroxy-6-metoxy-1,4-benzoquinol methylase